ncbi:response regulator [Candidatus Poribacteria bacterium]|nr:response regulator [Candidatus Poribacteria bacterium]
MGISPEEQATIFEPFQRGEASATKVGTGLGLTIAKRHIELMGGQLAVESPAPQPLPFLPPPEGDGKGERWRQGGKGSRFFFTVPFDPATQEMERREAAHGKRVAHLAQGDSVKALIADDVTENRAVLAKMLTEIGCDVLLAENGPDAVNQVRAHRPEIVFMDIRMPVMNGEDAMKKIWAEVGRGTVKIVAISASALAHQQEKYLLSGFDAFIPKPYRSEMLYHCLETLLGVAYEYADEDAEAQRAVLRPIPQHAS